MEALIASFLESLATGGAGAADVMSEAVAGGGMAPPTSMESLGSTMGSLGNQAIAPTMNAYNTFTNPNSTAGDMLSGAYRYAFSPQGKQDEQMMTPQQFSYGGGGMGSNYVGGIPSLLQNTGSGILPYIGSR
jgi:hypothetical protein